jgi:hypothetical protein
MFLHSTTLKSSRHFFLDFSSLFPVAELDVSTIHVSLFSYYHVQIFKVACLISYVRNRI